MNWYHSLYWRIAVGFVACLALLLVVQAILFVWVIARSGPRIPSQPPERFAQTVAFDLGQALEQNGALDLSVYIQQEYGRDAQPFFVLLSDERTIEVGGPFPGQVIAEARARLAVMRRNAGERENQTGRPFRPNDRSGRGGIADGAPPFARGERAARLRSSRPAVILVDQRPVGLVVVPPQPPFTFILTRYAPTLAGVAVVTLVVGALFATIAIFGPARRRLRAVEDAARRLGSGDLSARAPSGGDDEVSAVASAFNAMAEDLAARAAALTASDRARRQLLADVSHELTTPVTAMRGYLETLSMPEMVLDEATRARYLGIIGDETARLERIIGDLLELARLEGGGGALRIERVPVDELFARVRARHERALPDAGVDLHTTVAPGAESVPGDRDRLEQVLQNLAANALRYAPAGSSIELAARREGDAVVISVTDAGAGIAPEHASHVFDRFYKADTSRATRQGTGTAGGSGLGLSIVKAIVERHGGTVAVHSEPGRTTFALRLPQRESGLERSL